MRTIKYMVKEVTLIYLNVIQLLIFFTVWQHYEVNTYFRNIDKAWAIIASYMIIHMLLMKFFGVMEIGHKRLIDILFGEFMAVCFTNIITYFQLCMLQNYPYMYSIKVIGLIIIINSIVSFIVISLLQYIYNTMTPIQNAVLIMSEGDDLGKIMGKKRRNDKKIDIKKQIYVSNDFDIEKETKKYETVIIGDVYPLLRNNILKYCYENNKKCYAVSKTSDVLIQSAKFTQLGYRSVTLHNIKQMLHYQMFMKRLMDIVISLIGIIISLPLCIIIAIIIKFTDNGPVFFTQERYTRDKRIFLIYKFRSMYVGTDNVSKTRKNDERITPIGRFIRRTHIDEIPQLWNVLNGDMSLVGPRPEQIGMFDECEKNYPEYRYRLKMKAGLTGYAQVYGNYSISPKDKLKFDMIYICNYSLLLDIKLMLLTFKVFMAKDCSEGIGED